MTRYSQPLILRGKSLVCGHLRYLPLQSREACVVAIKRDPLAAPFDSECREPGVEWPGILAFPSRCRVPWRFPSAALQALRSGNGVAQVDFRRIRMPPRSHSGHGRCADWWWREQQRPTLTATSQSGSYFLPRPRATHGKQRAGAYPCGRRRSGHSRPAKSFQTPHAINVIQVLNLLECRQIGEVMSWQWATSRLADGRQDTLTFCARPAFGHRQPQPILDERGERAPLHSGLAFGALEQILRQSDGGSLGHICRDILLCRLYVNGGAIDPLSGGMKNWPRPVSSRASPFPFELTWSVVPAVTGSAGSTGKLAGFVGNGCVSSHSARAVTVGSTPALFHHAASSPQWCTSRWCPRHKGTVCSSLTFLPSARLWANRR